VQWLERAVALDSTFAEAYASLAYARLRLWFNSREPGSVEQARSAVDKAVAIAPDRVETHMAQAQYYRMGFRDFERALEHFELVRELRPSNAEALAYRGVIQRNTGMWDEALESLARAAELNPRAQATQFPLGQTQVLMGRFSDAERALDRAIAINPDDAYPHRLKMFLYLNRDGNRVEARRVLQEGMRMAPASGAWVEGHGLMRLFPDEYQGWLREINHERLAVSPAWYFGTWAQTYLAQGETELLRAYADSLRMVLEPTMAEPGQESQFTASTHSHLGLAYAALGRVADATREGELGRDLRPLAEYAYNGLQEAYWLATIYAMVGEYEKAIDQLVILVSVPTWHSANVARLDPTWDPLRDHPRFQALLEQYGN
jgi:serine/threonine-protein kinase